MIRYTIPLCAIGSNRDASSSICHRVSHKEVPGAVGISRDQVAGFRHKHHIASVIGDDSPPGIAISLSARGANRNAGSGVCHRVPLEDISGAVRISRDEVAGIRFKDHIAPVGGDDGLPGVAIPLSAIGGNGDAGNGAEGAFVAGEGLRREGERLGRGSEEKLLEVPGAASCGIASQGVSGGDAGAQEVVQVVQKAVSEGFGGNSSSVEDEVGTLSQRFLPLLQLSAVVGEGVAVELGIAQVQASGRTVRHQVEFVNLTLGCQNVGDLLNPIPFFI